LPPDVPDSKFVIGPFDGWLVMSWVAMAVILLGFAGSIVYQSKKSRTDSLTVEATGLTKIKKRNLQKKHYLLLI